MNLYCTRSRYMTRPKNDSTQQMKVYLVLDISRGAQPVLGCWTCAVDAVESAKQFPNAFVVEYRLNTGEEPCKHEYEADDRFENERATSTCRKCGDVQR
jgi:hypothetical protein